MEWLKWLIAGRELRALHRYRCACMEAHRWLGRVPNAAETAEWILKCGEDKPRVSIALFRESLERAP